MLNAWNFGYTFTAQNNVTPALNSINQGINQLGQAGADAASKIQRSFFEMEGAAQVAAKGLAAIDAMRQMRADFADFEAGMAEASTLLLGASVDMQEYENALISMSLKYGELPADLTKSLYTAISSGFVSASDSIAVLDQSIQLAVGGVTTAAEAMDGLTTILHAWGLTAADVKRVSDTLFVGMRAGKTTIGELAREIGQVASFAYQTGISLEEITAAAAALTLGGRTTAEAMNGLRSILAEVLRQEPGVMKTVEELEKASGVALKFSMSGIREKGLGKFLQDINTAVQRAGSETGIARMFGRVQGMSAVMSLTGAQAAKFTEIMDQMREKAGSTEDAVGKMMATSRMETRRYEASVKVMRIEIGRALVPILHVVRVVKQAFVDFFTSVARRAPWLIQLVSALIMVGAAVAVVIAKVFALKSLFILLGTFVKSLVASMAAGFAALAPVLLPVAAIIAAIVSTLYVFKRAYEENWSGFADWVDRAADAVYYLFDALRQLTKTGEITGATAEFLLMHDTVYSVVQGIWYLVTAVKWLIGGIVKGFKAVGDIFEPVKGQFEVMARTFRRIGQIFTDVLGDLGFVASDAVTPMKILGAIGYGIGATLAFAFRSAAAALGVLLSGLSAIVATLYAAFMAVWRIIRGVIRMFTGDISGGLSEILLAITQFAASILSVVLDLLDSILYGFVSIFGVTRETWNAFLHDLGAFFGDFVDGIVSAAVGIYNGVKWALGKVYEYYAWVLGGMAAVWEEFVNGFQWLWEHTIGALIEYLGFLGTAFDVLGQFLKSLWEPIFEWFESKLGWIKSAADGLSEIASGIGGAISSVGSGIASVGSNLKKGVLSIGDALFGGEESSGGGGGINWDSLYRIAETAQAKPVVTTAATVANPTAPTGATAHPATTAGAGAIAKSPVVQVVNKPANVVLRVDGRALADAVIPHVEAKKEEQMAVLLPVMTGFGGR